MGLSAPGTESATAPPKVRGHIPHDPFLGDRVFVYGTLRGGFADNATALAFRSGARFLSRGRLPGVLHSLGWYPAMVEGGGGMVVGEVWELARPGLIHMLDEYEGLFEADPPEYRRLRREIRIPDGPVTAWVYVYAGAAPAAERIPSGDWSDAV